MADVDYSAEEWRDIPEDDRYEISSFGRVRAKARILRPWLAGNGYEYIGLGARKRTTVHRLVCRAFHGPPPSPDHKLVAHWDGDPSNNSPENLRWATYTDNSQDSIRHGTSPLAQYSGKQPSREGHAMAKLTEADVAEIRRLGNTDIERNEIARRFGVSRNQIWRILRGKNW